MYKKNKNGTNTKYVMGHGHKRLNATCEWLHSNKNLSLEWFVDIVRTDCLNECSFEFGDTTVGVGLGLFGLFFLGMIAISFLHKNHFIECINKYDAFTFADDQNIVNIVLYGLQIALCLSFFFCVCVCVCVCFTFLLFCFFFCNFFFHSRV